MRARVQKWGNSLAVRIPRAFAAEVGLEENSPVELSLEGRSLVIRPSGRVSLASLVAAITDDNRHGEVDTGPRAGSESW